MKRLILSVLCIAMLAATAHAATNIRIPTDQANLNLAVAAANDGDTITFTDSATYVGNFKITKPNLTIIAAPGQKPTIQSGSGGTTPTLLFDTDSGGTKFGSLTGGRIRVNFVKPSVNTATVPTGFVKFGQSTDSLVTMENVLIDESGPTDGSGYGVNAIAHDINNHNQVVLRYVDINTSHSITGAATTNGIIIGNPAPALNTGYPSYLYNSRGGPTYTMDHVKVKYYCVAGIMQVMTSTTLNMSYCDVGVLGDSGREPGNTSRPWGSFNQNGVSNASSTIRMDHCIWRGSRAGNNFQVD
ncbi:MAG: hypothetical protein EG826_18330, partial [Deltaproteobacteria bacterium]|nr:hypothetical protein [Deltaproteobacteria bacterium]